NQSLCTLCLDCCDGSDEYAGYTKCSNYCEEAGMAAREEAARRNAVQREGYQKRGEFVRQGREKKSENARKLKELQEIKENVTKQVDELDMVKQVAEKSEKEAKDLHISKWKAEIEAQDKIKQKEKATEAFGQFDIDSDQRLSTDELSQRMEFDKNQDGKVNEEEISEYFGESKHIALDDFINAWPLIKDVYRPPVPEELPIAASAREPIAASRRSKPISDIKSDDQSLEKMEVESESEDEIREDEVEDFDTSSSPPFSDSNSKTKDEDQENMPDFDDNTKKLIADADQARKEYDEAKKKLRDLEDETRRLEEFERIDFGMDNEFAGLHRQCFEYSDMQYTYGLCLFDRTYQKPIGSSHSDVGLGTWDSWTGHENDKYSKQSYKHGLTCWNGPARSTEIKLTCGIENKLISATEPAKCEYVMEFETPVVCSEPENIAVDAHLEL
uniref:Glucosidase 2 subunit beta n=1 Tax=Romanomermis culicivorax TaxID=13658 RepID=A0A915IFM3_ROMCU